MTARTASSCSVMQFLVQATIIQSLVQITGIGLLWMYLRIHLHYLQALLLQERHTMPAQVHVQIIITLQDLWQLVRQMYRHLLMQLQLRRQVQASSYRQVLPRHPLPVRSVDRLVQTIIRSIIMMYCLEQVHQRQLRLPES